jgi:hypothetical protein
MKKVSIQNIFEMARLSISKKKLKNGTRNLKNLRIDDKIWTVLKMLQGIVDM